MVTTRPRTLLVQASRSGQTLHAAPNQALPPPRRAGRIATVTRAGQVTVWACRSTRNWSLANRPPGAAGSWVVTIGASPWVSIQARWVPVP